MPDEPAVEREDGGGEEPHLVPLQDYLLVMCQSGSTGTDNLHRQPTHPVRHDKTLLLTNTNQ